ncbi:hypothetical protein BC938DRAFT_471866 [Jimgerdemannia flammicorona]|uniref:Uncharacterized protein n=1 Tax=Jimgerdemannia flammicorona TaxID=994334 RepID=A0A433Q799_9FUNG|nr:hypothetical protein BC938DRAFT_471866 [Jimgerdemannia flammicorona]
MLPGSTVFFLGSSLLSEPLHAAHNGAAFRSSRYGAHRSKPSSPPTPSTAIPSGFQIPTASMLSAPRKLGNTTRLFYQVGRNRTPGILICQPLRTVRANFVLLGLLFQY